MPGLVKKTAKDSVLFALLALTQTFQDETLRLIATLAVGVLWFLRGVLSRDREKA